MIERVIHTGLSPNLSFAQVKHAFKLLFQPKHWIGGQGSKRLEEEFKRRFKVKSAISFNAGRSALYAVLKTLAFPKNSEVMLQAFTCAAVPNSVIWAGYKPVYVDIDQTLNFDVVDAEKKVTRKTKAVIVQHTFGVPANLKLIKEFCLRYKLVLIEDCAHALGAKYGGQSVGTFSDAAIFSFGRDKVISGVFGGMAITNNKKIGDKIKALNRNIGFPNKWWIIQNLLHPPVTFIALYTYNFFKLGRLLIYLFQKLNLLNKPVYGSELTGEKLDEFPKKLPTAMAQLILSELTRLDYYNRKRQQIANYYYTQLSNKSVKLPEKISGAIYMRFNILTQNAQQLFNSAKLKNIFLGNWYRHVIDPEQVNLTGVGYKPGSCPKAEQAAEVSVNLPTYPVLSAVDLKRIVELFN